MESKKSNKANLDRKRGHFFEIGMLIALGIVLLAFEMQIATKEGCSIGGLAQVSIEDVMVPVTRFVEPPPPPPAPPKVTDILEIVENDVLIDAQIHIDVDVNLLTPITAYDYSFSEIDDVDETIPFSIIEEKPKFNGKDADVGFREWVYSKIVYPPAAVDNVIKGRIYTEFTIDKDGSITDIKILRGADPLLNAEALRVLKMSPKWTPGKQRGKAVKVTFQFPFVFDLQ